MENNIMIYEKFWFQWLLDRWGYLIWILKDWDVLNYNLQRSFEERFDDYNLCNFLTDEEPNEVLDKKFNEIPCAIS